MRGLTPLLLGAAIAAEASDALLPSNAAEAGEGYVYIVRHGEKSHWWACLNTTGMARAAAFPSIFDGNPRPSGERFYTPRALVAYFYGDDYHDGHKDCERCVETLMPISQTLGLPIQQVAKTTAHMANDAASLIMRLIGEQASSSATGPPVVLVAWNHHQIDALTEALRVAPGQLPSWPDTDFGMVFQLVVRPHAFTASDNRNVLASLTVSSEEWHPSSETER